MSNIDKRALREAAEKATALNLDTAQVKRGDDGYLECPCCEGAGYVEEEADFCNIDGVALGVQFYGIGDHHGLAEKYFRAANPATVLALLDELEAAEKLNAELMEKQRLIDICQGQGLEHRIAAEKRAEAAEKRIAELERKEQHSERQSVIDALAGSGEEWSDIEEYMQKWDAERAAAAGKGE